MRQPIEWIETHAQAALKFGGAHRTIGGTGITPILAPLARKTKRSNSARAQARLSQRLSREEAIGNFVDGRVRQNLRQFMRENGISTAPGEVVRINNRAYRTSGSERTFRIPDARIGDVVFDVTLTQKTLAQPQIRGFFNADFRPTAVVIVRPSQPSPQGTYIITRPLGN
ncbi:MAG: hypothetical protein R3C25_07980 [Hyphomonadaceae bacterium]